MPNFENPQKSAEEKKYIPPQHGGLKDITPEIIGQNLALLRSIEQKKGNLGLIDQILNEPDETQAALKLHEFRTYYRDVILEMRLDMAQVLRKIIALRRLTMRAVKIDEEPEVEGRETPEPKKENLPKKEKDFLLEKHLDAETLEFLESQGFFHIKREYREDDYEVTEFIFFPDPDKDSGRGYINTLSWGNGLVQSRLKFNARLSGRHKVKLGTMSSLEYPTTQQAKALLENEIKEKIKENLPDLAGDKLFAIYTKPDDLRMLEGKGRTFVWEKMEDKGKHAANLSKIAEGATRSDVHIVSLPVLTLRIKNKK